MSDAKRLVTLLFQHHNISIPPGSKTLFDKFLQDEQNKIAIRQIVRNQNELMTRWKQEERLAAISQQPVRVLNATVGKPYETLFDTEKLNWKDIAEFQFEGLQDLGLVYDEKTKQITGVPVKSGDYKIRFRFRLRDEPQETPLHEKLIPLIINPDPKSLWKKLDSDRNDPYWKEDDLTVFVPLNDRHLLASSKRGRSHANVGSFREDDFAYKDLDNGWSIVVVADGAGSAKVSRKGSALACNGIVEFFSQKEASESLAGFDALLHNYTSEVNVEAQKALYRFVYNNLGKAALTVHKQLQSFAQEQNLTLKDLSTTLIFTLLKRYESGYALLSFGVGDCPIAVLNTDLTEVHLMNWIDVGEFGGGTRFITMPEIFQNEKFSTRFGFKLMKDFSYLVLMSDGIYDPKFSVEANLANIKKWQAFFNDLAGQNEDKIKVELNPENKDIEEQLSQWMDFWSPGNHDDRTLAIVF
ncbi:MAG TPA: PP2C family serine/threonine-protein phosphatase [Flavisolibacter sp.]